LAADGEAVEAFGCEFRELAEGMRAAKVWASFDFPIADQKFAKTAHQPLTGRAGEATFLLPPTEEVDQPVELVGAL
jgi:hypothetical protein